MVTGEVKEIKVSQGNRGCEDKEEVAGPEEIRRWLQRMRSMTLCV